MQDEIDDLFGAADEDDPPAGGKQKNPVAEQRKHIKELEARLKEIEPAYEELTKFKTQYDSEQRESTLKTVFEELGVSDKAVKFFKLENPDGEVSKETVARWAVENEFATPDQFEGTEKTDAGFVPTTHGDGFIPGAKRYSRKEFEKLLSTGNVADQLAANKAVEQGRVDFDSED